MKFYSFQGVPMRFRNSIYKNIALGLSLVFLLQVLGSVDFSALYTFEKGSFKSLIKLFSDSEKTETKESRTGETLEKEENKEENKTNLFTNSLKSNLLRQDSNFSFLSESIKSEFIKIQSPPPKFG